MSAINQMLRDLDARSDPQVPSSTALDVADRLPRSDKRRWTPIGLGVSALGIVIMGGYFALSGARPERRETLVIDSHATPVASESVVIPFPLSAAQHNPAVVLQQPAEAGAVTVQTPPSLRASPPILTEDPAAVLRKSDPAGVAITETKALKLASVSQLLTNAAETETPKVSAVIKRPVEPSPAAAALQLLEEANALRREGKPDAARRKYRDALEQSSGLSRARIQLAEIMDEQGDTEAAFAELKTAYTQQPEADLAVALGRMLASRSQRAEALTWFARGSAILRPADHALTAALLAQELRYTEAIRAYQTALASEPHKGGWLLGLGLAYDATGQREAAQAAYRLALAWGEFKPEVVKFLNERSGLAP